jgi:hypothetical protein
MPASLPCGTFPKEETRAHVLPTSPLRGQWSPAKCSGPQQHLQRRFRVQPAKSKPGALLPGLPVLLRLPVWPTVTAFGARPLLISHRP